MPTPEAESRPERRARWALVGLILTLAAARLYYDTVAPGPFGQSAALFIGLPTVIAIGLTLSFKSKSLLAQVLAGMLLALLLAAILLPEGAICLLMAAPLFLLIAGLFAGLVELLTGRRAGGSGPRRTGIVALPFLLLSLEGMHPALSLPREAEVVVSRRLEASPEEIAQALARPPRFDRPLPAFLRLGFPRPAGEGAWAALGPDRQRVSFAVGEMPMGQLDIARVETGPNLARFEILEDTTPIGRWLAWQGSEMRWRGLPDGGSEVTWTLRYERRLDPAWYFGPWERYGTRLAAGYLIDTIARP